MQSQARALPHVGASSIVDGILMISNMEADVMVVGASEAPINPLIVAGFNQIRALAEIAGERPIESYSRPFDKARTGFVLGEGAAVLILEELEHAKRRGAAILAEITGFGVNNDCYHLTAPDPEGQGAISCMKKALFRAGIAPSELGYLNAHATSTPIGMIWHVIVGDKIEGNAIFKLFDQKNQTKTPLLKRSESAGKELFVKGQTSSDDRNYLASRRGLDIEECRHVTPCIPLLVSSTKGATGHLLGAAGAMEALFTVLALKHNIAPPTLNLEQYDLESIEGSSNIEYPAKYALHMPFVKHLMSNSFGFGGVNISLLFTKTGQK
ncbi:mitochondrial 3-oxoacyl-(Acyl-carrier-protein) synthase [Mitosporidium daphniae]|uniref:beta-ketoacyl-[acyl-carrier-protein] synthase I n=1 Tax=Mitosporidium daphniae TaxID=1485682 RepID=A0A098VXK1_9MICR|nr:mitochondrial 3-oxoacyl-(Acyl-carrier-protein) synthase [Mitosporidium daphniae]KGG52466.1 mitochondrial 3-oxoacyl-(Acyl-carrier-protein) synthase [Mitosporidium daphniae]|eukprot:XP_013238893.1 mitochondrial 3-oxoacyl-(Acyl-carrier-protein) synthase [Mitosporidium daphniae]